jgi:hypothetical protein
VFAGGVCVSVEAALSWQIEAASTGSEAAKATMRNATIGANNCTNIESSTIGMNTSSRRRMIFPETPWASYHSR